ncbi:hypothetical protein I6F35_02975 [Bradyrhizobium sp. BRP22]|uniref:hypothetical protein n=1 Tax=Bradyrhizobium sp. BRP22 TaxID=2793821 RepID=UPI001CD54CBF|nr:hypothetical protein [Bradyrhizobium sp. BRP22]MCA1452178.1 hypothetical protein [Bradyrhizobium sp. BRP22]
MIAKIRFDKPNGAEIDDIAAFIHDALTSWGGQFHPDDPLFHSLNVSRITVHGQEYFCAQKRYHD